MSKRKIDMATMLHLREKRMKNEWKKEFEKEMKDKKTLVGATLVIPTKGDVREQIKHIHNAELELEKAGVIFDTWHPLSKDLKGKYRIVSHDWELDRSLRGGKLVFRRFKKKKKVIKRKH